MSKSTNEAASERAESVELTDSERHRLLAKERRRVALDVLADRSLPLSLSGLAADVADREAGAGTVTETHVERVAVTLHHADLPTMDELGIIDYDPDSRRVEGRRIPDAVAS